MDHHDPLSLSIRSVLTPDLLRPEFRTNPRPFAGHCYVASEVYFHLSGGKASRLVPTCVRHEGTVHWWLRDPCSGRVVDLTAEQFETPVPYSAGRGCGFLTAGPSSRAKEVIRRLSADHLR